MSPLLHRHSRRLRIGIVTDWYLPRIGGLELHVRDLARHLVRHGHEVHVICATRAEADSATPDGSRDGVRIHRLAVPLTPRFHTIAAPGAIKALREVFVRERFDVVHTHNVFSPLAHAGAWLARRMGLPSLLTECSVLRGPVGGAFRLARSLVPWADYPTLLSGVSRFVAEDLRRASRRAEVFTLHNGIDPAAWAVSRREPAQPRIVSVMRFTRRKRPLDLVRIIPEVQRRLPASLRPRFTLVGDGPQMEAVRREAARLRVEEQLDLPGFLPREQIRDLLGESTLFALPTRKEAMSIASLEALAAGCPVVAMNTGGICDVVESGREGLLADTPEQFVEHLVRLLRDDVLRRSMASQTVDKARQFDWDTMIRRHENLFALAEQRLGGAASERVLDELGEVVAAESPARPRQAAAGGA